MTAPAAGRRRICPNCEEEPLRFASEVEPDSYHWHCGHCGDLTGQFGHYKKITGNEWGFSCKTE